MKTLCDFTPDNARNRQAFTLTDLLVVIAILGILTLLLLPAQARTRNGSTATGCRANLEQIGRAMLMYTNDNQDQFSQCNIWWTPGPYHNVKGFAPVGGEWLGSGVNAAANTPAPMLARYLPDNYVWVCPKRKRGLTSVAQPGEFDPSITGFLSYGFNMLCVFAKIDRTTGNMSSNPSTPPNKLSSLAQPADTIAISETSGSNDPGQLGGTADSAWLDSVWVNGSGQNQPATGQTQNIHVQTAYAKHNSRLNTLFVDGHVSVALGSQLTWRQFFGDFVSNTRAANGSFKNLDEAISKPAYDSIEWSSAPE